MGGGREGAAGGILELGGVGIAFRVDRGVERRPSRRHRTAAPVVTAGGVSVVNDSVGPSMVPLGPAATAR